MDAQLLPQSSVDSSYCTDGSHRNGSLDGYVAAPRDGSSLHMAQSGGTYHSFTQGQQQSRSAGAASTPFQAHQTAVARNGMRRFGSSDNLAGLGLPGHQRSGETKRPDRRFRMLESCWLHVHSSVDTPCCHGLDARTPLPCPFTSSVCCAPGHHSSGALRHAHTVDGPVAAVERPGLCHPPRNGKTHHVHGGGSGSMWHRQQSEPAPVMVPEHKAVVNGNYVSSRHTTLQVDSLLSVSNPIP